MPAPLHIVVVEDHAALREMTVDALAQPGWQVTGFESAEALCEACAALPIDIAVLDLNLPGEDGLSLARRLRERKPEVGIVMLTVRDSVAQRVAGYEHGADIYLPKPTSSAELVAAVAALARRLVPVRLPSEMPKLDVQAGVLHTAKGTLALRGAETALLRALALAPDGLLESWQLLDVLQKPFDEDGKRQLAVIVTRLRAKLEAHGLATPAIRSERGIGYRLVLPLTLA